VPLSDLVIRVGADIENFKAGMAAVSAELGKIESAANRLTAGMRRFGESLSSVGTTLSVGITAPLSAFALASGKAAADLDALRRGLQAVAGSASEAAKQLAVAAELAKLPGLGFREAVQALIQLQAGGFQFQESARIIREFGNALALVGRGREDLNEVIRQLTQLAARGKVTADNLKPIIERVPQVAQIIRKEFGTLDTEVLQKMGVSAQRFIDVLVRGLSDLPRVTGGIRNDFENLRDAMERSLARVGEVMMPLFRSLLQAAEYLVEHLRGVAEAFSSLPVGVQAAVLALGAFSAAIGPIAFGIGQTITAIAQLTKAATSIYGALATATEAVIKFGQSMIVAAQTQMAVGGVKALEAALISLGKAAAVAAAAFAAYEIGKAAYNWWQASRQVSDANKALLYTVEQLEQRLRAHGIVIERGNMSLEEYAARLREAARGIQSTGQAAESGKRAHDAYRKSVEDEARAQREAEAARRRAAMAAKQLEDALVALGARSREAIEFRELSKQMELIEQAFKQGKVSAYEYSVALENFQKRLEQMRDPMAFIRQEFTQFGSTIQYTETLFRDLDAVMRQAMTGSVQQAAELDRAFGEIAAGVEQLSLRGSDYWKTLEAGMGRTRELIGVATQEVQRKEQAWNSLGRQVSTVLTDMSRGIADAILQAKSLGDVFINTAKEIGKAILRFVVEEAIGGLVRAIGQLIRGDLVALGRAFDDLIGKMRGIGDAAQQVFGGAGSATRGGGGAGATPSAPSAPSGGLAGTLTAVGAIVDAITSVFSYFQGRRMEQDIARIEVTTRGIFSQVISIQETLNTWLPWIRHLADPLWDTVHLLTGIHDLIAQSARTASGATTAQRAINLTVNVQGTTTDERALAERVTATIVRELRLQGAML
jgi:tape measure domain-containing protein